MPLSLNDLASTYTAWDGAVLIHMLSFTPFALDAHVDAFSAIHPRYLYTHTVTGEQQNEMPAEYAAALEFAKGMTKQERDELKPFEDLHWTRKDLWNDAAKAFAMCDPLTVGIEMVDLEKVPNAAKGLCLYWEARGTDVEENWTLFQQSIGAEAVGVWGAAYGATRDRRMDAPTYAQTAPTEDSSPKASGGGRSTGKPSRKTSRTSPTKSASSATNPR